MEARELDWELLQQSRVKTIIGKTCNRLGPQWKHSIADLKQQAVILIMENKTGLYDLMKTSRYDRFSHRLNARLVEYLRKEHSHDNDETIPPDPDCGMEIAPVAVTEAPYTPKMILGALPYALDPVGAFEVKTGPQGDGRGSKGTQSYHDIWAVLADVRRVWDEPFVVRPEGRKAVLLAAMGYTHREIGNMYGLKEDAVRKRIEASLRKMADWLNGDR